MKKRILVVEDDPDILEIIEIVLNGDNYQVSKSTTGKDVVELIHKNNPHLILMDIRLGELDGRQICRDLKKGNHCINTPIILMSAHAVSTDVKNEVCASDFISKPFDIDDLLMRVKKLIVQ